MMTSNKEILKKAIQLANKKGYYLWDDDAENREILFTEYSVIVDPDAGSDADECYYYEIIFDHDFAKALWGRDQDYAFYAGYDEWAEVDDEEVDEAADFDEIPRDQKPAWQYHLQQMVISDDPIKYLGNNLPQEMLDDK